MKKNKIITFILAAMMMASLAIPASAATAENTTTVNFSYKSDKTIDAENEDNVYTITIPAQIDLELVEENGDNGVSFKGEDTISVSGMIGQSDYVEVAVGSAKHYTLTGDGATAAYKMTATTDGEGTTINSRELSQSNTKVNSNDKLFTSTSRAFRNNDTVTLTFESDGNNNIYGKCDVSDTLTFTYQYAAANENGGYNVTSGNVENTFEYATDNSKDSHDAN